MGDKFDNDFSPSTGEVEDSYSTNKKKQLLEYLNKYKFERDPFSDNLYSGLFFPGCGRQQAVQSILHYSRFGSTPVYLTGPSGSGKTTVLLAAMREILDDVDVVSIDAEIMMTSDRLFSLISQGFGILNENISINEIIGVIEANIALGRQSLICIDNVEQLSQDAVTSLFELLVACDGQLNVIFVGQDHSTDLFLEIAKSSNLLINRIELSSLNETEVYNYICYRLDAIGFEFEFPLSSIQLKALTHRCQGNIKNLHTIARSMLMAGLVDMDKKNGRFPIGHLFLLFFLLAFVGLIFQQKKIENIVQDYEPIILETVNENLDISISSKDDMKSSQESNNYIQSEEFNLIEEEVTEISKKQLNDEKIKEEAKANNNSRISAKETLLSWDPSQYALQIFRTNDLKKARDLLMGYEKQVELLIYETRYNGMPSFVVVNGPYNNIEIARSSKDLLPEKIRKLGPWPRSVASINSDIERYSSVIDPIQ